MAASRGNRVLSKHAIENGDCFGSRDFAFLGKQGSQCSNGGVLLSYNSAEVKPGDAFRGGGRSPP